MKTLNHRSNEQGIILLPFEFNTFIRTFDIKCIELSSWNQNGVDINSYSFVFDSFKTFHIFGGYIIYHFHNTTTDCGISLHRVKKVKVINDDTLLNMFDAIIYCKDFQNKDVGYRFTFIYN